MQDGLELGRKLATADTATVKQSLKEYQDAMLARGANAVKKSREAVFDDGSSTKEGWERWIINRQGLEKGAAK